MTDLNEALEHHAQSLQLLTHVRFMGVVANVETRIQIAGGQAWLAAASLSLSGKPIPKRWLKVLEVWQAQWALEHPVIPEIPPFPFEPYADDIVLLAITALRSNHAR